MYWKSQTSIKLLSSTHIKAIFYNCQSKCQNISHNASWPHSQPIRSHLLWHIPFIAIHYFCSYNYSQNLLSLTVSPDRCIKNLQCPQQVLKMDVNLHHQIRIRTNIFYSWLPVMLCHPWWMCLIERCPHKFTCTNLNF